MPQPLTLILVEKTGELKTLNVKDYKEEELFKKCGFKKADNFLKQTEWSVKINGQNYVIMLYGKEDGKANIENKYDFPPPIDSKLLFGCCVLVGYIRDSSGKKILTNLSIDLWSKIYEKLFGGFEDLTNINNENEDENEEDELDNISKSKKTKNSGYLKDGFVVDDDSNDISESNDEYNSSDETDETDNDDDSRNKCEHKNKKIINENENDDLILDDVGSELSEDSYDYN